MIKTTKYQIVEHYEGKPWCGIALLFDTKEEAMEYYSQLREMFDKEGKDYCKFVDFRPVEDLTIQTI